MAKMSERPVEWAKLEREFEKRGLNASEVAVELGYARGYFAGCKHEGRNLSMAVKRMLEKLYDIRPDEYEVKEEPATVPTAPPPVIQPFELDYVRLYNIMYEAVYNAVKKAWSE